MEVERMYPAFKIDPQDEIVKKAQEAFNRIGIKSYTASTGGGSDTNVLNSYGVKAVNLGVGMTKVHTLEENIKIQDIVDSSRMVAELIKIFGE